MQSNSVKLNVNLSMLMIPTLTKSSLDIHAIVQYRDKDGLSYTCSIGLWDNW